VAGLTKCDNRKCQKTFERKKPWQRFCCTSCHDEEWKTLRKEVTEFIMHGRKELEKKRVGRGSIPEDK
jgi:hypothetical protein